MPPAGKPRPDQTSYNNLISYLETSLDKAAELKPDPGRTEALHRLNRAEYRNAVRDLLALDIDVSAMLPADDVSYGFDNIAGVQRMSPTLMERYLAAAEKISGIAVGASARAATTDTFLVPSELRQDDRLEGLPFGTRGGSALRYNFPRDGTYSVRVQLTRYVGASFDEIPVFDELQRLELSVDGAPVHVFELQPDRCGRRARLRSGTQSPRSRCRLADPLPGKGRPAHGCVDVPESLSRAAGKSSRAVRKPVPGGPNGYYTTQKGAYLRSVEISGPYESAGTGTTPSRERIFACRPDAPADEAACAEKILSTLARRAFRRPVSKPDMETLLSLYKEGRAEGGFELGIERGVEGLLVSPEFLYRVEQEPESLRKGGRVSRQRFGARFAPVIFPVEQHSGRSAAGCRGVRQTARSRCTRAAGASNARRSASRRRRQQFRRAVAVPAAIFRR